MNIKHHLFLIIFAVSLSSEAKDRKPVNWKDCRQAGMGNSTVPFTIDHQLVKQCAPEVIYSWREDVSLNHMIDAEKKGKGIVSSHPNKKLFAAKTPISSQGYGMTGIRIKLKDDVKFVFANKEGDYVVRERSCNYFKEKYPDDYERIVIVAYLDWYNFSEYILCNEGPIHSWSYGTQEHLAEIENEYKYFLNNPKPGSHESVKHDFSVIDSDNCADDRNCSPNKFQEKLQRHKKMVKEQGGQIFYSSGIEKDRSEHFYTSREFYYSLSNDQLQKFGTTNNGVKKFIPIAPLSDYERSLIK